MEATGRYSVIFDGNRQWFVSPGADAKRRKVGLVTFPSRKRDITPLEPDEIRGADTALRKRCRGNIFPVWFPKRGSFLALWTPVFTADLERGKSELDTAVDAPSRHVMVARAQIVNANNTIPESFAPCGMQSEVELVATLERQYGPDTWKRRSGLQSRVPLALSVDPQTCDGRFWRTILRRTFLAGFVRNYVRVLLTHRWTPGTGNPGRAT